MTRSIAARRRGVRIAMAALAVFGFAGAAQAHRLKMFATVEAGEISGYAFFIGGGRPEGVDFVIKDAAGAEVFRGKTDERGTFRWRPTSPADYTVTVDAGDGHWIEGSIAADRLGAVATKAMTTTAASTSAATSAAAPAPVPTAACPAPVDPAAIAAIVEARVDASVARQLRPFIEAYDQAEGRVRLNDVMGGVGMIVGLAGAGLWATSRRRREGEG